MSFVCGAAVLAAATVRAGEPVESWLDQIDPWVVDTALSTPSGRTEFIVFLREQADLRAAAGLPTKTEKGRYVYERLRAMAQSAQKPILSVLDQLGVECRSFWVANMIWVRGDLGLAEALADRPEVQRICANPAVRLIPPTAAADRMAETAGIEWNISQVNAPAVWALGYTGQGAIVAGADTGYDWDHPALVGHYRGWDGTNANHNYNWHDAIHSGSSGCGVNSPAPCDGHWHGTHTMGTMVGDDGAANRIGMAPGARWIGTRNMNDSGAGTPATYSECFEWFIAPTDLNGQNPDPARAPDVINNSWGCPASEGCTSPDVLRTVVENTRAAGIVVVASAGNDGSGCSTINVPPSIYEAAFTVGATDGSDAAASFSSRGPVTVDGSGRRKPDVSAPGVSVRSSTPGTGYALSSGTSMAGPHVAGLVALVLSAHPGLKGQVDRIETLLEKTCRPRTTTQNCGTIPGTNVPNNTYGWGRIDALAAVGVNDSDGDGMPNWWEVIFGMDSTNAVDGAADSDCDGFSNAEEYLSNTDPTNASSRLRMSDISVTTAGVVTITWSSRQDGFDASRKYDVVRLAGGLGESNVWTVIASNVAAAGATTSVNDDSGGTATQWFYRVNIAGTGGVGAGMAGPSGR